MPRTSDRSPAGERIRSRSPCSDGEQLESCARRTDPLRAGEWCRALRNAIQWNVGLRRWLVVFEVETERTEADLRLHLHNDAVLIVREPYLGLASVAEQLGRERRLDDDRRELAGSDPDRVAAHDLEVHW